MLFFGSSKFIIVLKYIDLNIIVFTNKKILFVHEELLHSLYLLSLRIKLSKCICNLISVGFLVT